MNELEKVKMIEVDSSNISQIGYSEDDKFLFVKFTSGSIYKYIDVSIDIWETFQKAESKGIYFGKVIKNTYEFEKI